MQKLNVKQPPLIQITKLGLLLLMGVSMSAYSSTMSWKEEVLLHDGSKIIAERFYNLGGRPTIDSRERKSLDETVTFTLPGSNKVIIWKTDFRDSLPEPNSLNLLLIDVVKGMPYMALTLLDVLLTTNGNARIRHTFFLSMKATTGSVFRWKNFQRNSTKRMSLSVGHLLNCSNLFIRLMRSITRITTSTPKNTKPSCGKRCRGREGDVKNLLDTRVIGLCRMTR